MPRNSLYFVNRQRQTDEELELKAQMYHVNEAAMKPPKLKKNTRLWSLVNLTYNRFYLSGTAAPVKSTEMAIVLHSISKPTIIKIKEILGIRSIRRDGVWYWTFPLRPPDEAQRTIHERILREYNPYREELKRRHRPAAETLIAIMEELNCVATAAEAIRLMMDEGYKKSVAIKVKSELGIVTSRKDGHTTMWLYAGERVTDWLSQQLKKGPVPVLQLQQDVVQMGWPWELITMARQILGGITITWQSGDQVWTDVNRHTAPEPDNVIEVDFSEEEPDTVIAKTVTVGGIKMEVFE